MPADDTKPVISHKRSCTDVPSIKQALAEALTYAVGKDSLTATVRDWFNSAAYVVRDQMIERWMQTMRGYYDADAKRVYYFSMEFMMGRTLMNSLQSLELDQQTRSALTELGVDLERVRDVEYDAAL